MYYRIMCLLKYSRYKLIKSAATSIVGARSSLNIAIEMEMHQQELKPKSAKVKGGIYHGD